MEDTSHHSAVANPSEISSKITSDTTDPAQLFSSNSLSNELSNVLSFWKSFNLFSSRPIWEKTCNEMREMKTTSISARKKLNEMTKSFRAKTKEEQLAGNTISDLLKAYQEGFCVSVSLPLYFLSMFFLLFLSLSLSFFLSFCPSFLEIDSLSRRSKLSESAYVGIYKSLYDAPDPAFYLEQLLSTQSSSNSYLLEIEKLKSELSQYEEEFQTLKNQEITIRRLEEQLSQYLLNNEITIDEEIVKRTEIIRNETNQEVMEIKELNKSIERRLNLGKFSVSSLSLLCLCLVSVSRLVFLSILCYL
jgi:homeobox protein cut-like